MFDTFLTILQSILRMFPPFVKIYHFDQRLFHNDGFILNFAIVLFLNFEIYFNPLLDEFICHDDSQAERKTREEIKK